MSLLITMDSIIENDEQMEWINSKNQKCRFFFNTNSNHYVLSINGFYFEHNRMLRDNLITTEDLATFDSLNLYNMRDNIDFLKRISDEIKLFRNVNGELIRKKVAIQKKNNRTTKINNCIVYL